MKQIDSLVIRFDPYLGPTVRTILTRFNHLIISRDQDQDGNEVRRNIELNCPDGNDVNEMIRQLTGWGVSVERQTA